MRPFTIEETHSLPQDFRCRIGGPCPCVPPALAGRLRKGCRLKPAVRKPRPLKRNSSAPNPAPHAHAYPPRPSSRRGQAPAIPALPKARTDREQDRQRPRRHAVVDPDPADEGQGTVCRRGSARPCLGKYDGLKESLRYLGAPLAHAGPKPPGGRLGSLIGKITVTGGADANVDPRFRLPTKVDLLAIQLTRTDDVFGRKWQYLTKRVDENEADTRFVRQRSDVSLRAAQGFYPVGFGY